MRYHATIGGRQRVIDVEAEGKSTYRVSIDGGTAQIIDAERVEPRVWSLLHEGRSAEVTLELDGDTVQALASGTTVPFDLLDERRHRQRAARQGSVISGPVVIRAPMPGKIVKVLVVAGQEVAENQGLIIIEAMKMENELRSPKAGRIREIKAVEGQTVESRAELIAVE